MSERHHTQDGSAKTATKASDVIPEQPFDPAPDDPRYVGEQPKEVVTPRRRYAARKK